MPHDYFDGRPLRYRPQAEGTYRLYSVGENGTDEGGAAARDSSKSPPPWTGPDLVWPWPTAGER
jgi:hypothetical protein